ncbi:MAG TPA: glycosyltransferase, partial [Firmicutes bacterium]|nr:glycosyltransferase [Bacillota bacterium]
MSLIVLSWNTRDITLACLNSIVSNPSDVSWELIVIDNASSDGSAEAIVERFGSDAHVRIIENTENLGFTGGNNQGMEMAFGKIIGLLNSDTIVPPGALNGLYNYL